MAADCAQGELLAVCVSLTVKTERKIISDVQVRLQQKRNNLFVNYTMKYLKWHLAPYLKEDFLKAKVIDSDCMDMALCIRIIIYAV